MSPLDPDLAKYLNTAMRADLDAWANGWFWALVGSTIVVAVGIICEAPEVLHALGVWDKASERISYLWYVRVRKLELNGWEKTCPEILAKSIRATTIAKWGLIGWSLVAIGVAGEGFAEYIVNDAETDLRVFDQAELIETQQSALSAATASSVANTFADRSVASSDKALTIARGAREEAESFETDIKSAKATAAEAKSQIGDAFKQATEATAELNRLKTPRTLTNIPMLVDLIKEFRGQEYVFIGVFSDQESVDLLKQIDSALQLAGWVRGKPTMGNIVLTIDKDFQVSPTLSSGLQVAAQSTEKLTTLQVTPLFSLPRYLVAANDLKHGLHLAITPTQDDLAKGLGVDPGNSTAVFILVGKKP